MNSYGVNQYTLRRRPIGTIIMSWFGAVLSIFVAMPIGNMLVANVAAFRPCSINSSGITVASCGKTSVDITDLILSGLFFGAVMLVVCAVTHAIRMTRKS